MARRVSMDNSETADNEAERLQELMVEQMRDLYHAENQLVKALPKLSKAAHDPELKKAFDDHLEQTREHVSRLERSFELLDTKPRTKVCKGMMGIVEEGSEVIREGKQMEEEDADLALIAGAQKAEHYEIASYGTLRTYAEKIGEEEVADLLRQTEDEEKSADSLLTENSMRLINQMDGSQ
jgi:ferritin-like metal-binding protein YciE